MTAHKAQFLALLQLLFKFKSSFNLTMFATKHANIIDTRKN